MSSPDENEVKKQRESEFAEARECIIAASAIHRKRLPDSRFFKRAWDKGLHARCAGFMRVSPYYEDPLRTPYWFAGYDRIPFAPPMIVKPIATETPAELASA